MSSIMKGLVDESDWTGGVAKWKKEVTSKHGNDITFKKKQQPGVSGQTNTYATNSDGKVVGVYQHHNNMGRVLSETIEEADPFKAGYKAWKDYQAGKTNYPKCPYPAGQGMGRWYEGQAAAAEGGDYSVNETEAKKGVDGKRCWKGKRYAGTENGKDICIPVKEESETKWEVAIEYGPTANHTVKIKVSAPDEDTAQTKALAQFKKKYPDRRGMVGGCSQIKEAANPAQQAAIAIAKKKKAKTNEGVIVGHDANDPEVAILGGAGTMSLSRLKKKAHGEALQLADDIANGKYNASSYNMKQLHNTLNTIVAAEKEMEKLYFGEGILDVFRSKDQIEARAKAKSEKYKKIILESNTQISKIIQALNDGHYKKANILYDDSHLEHRSSLVTLLEEAVYHFDPDPENVLRKLVLNLEKTRKRFIKLPNEFASDFVEDLQEIQNHIQKLESITEDYTGEFAAEKTPEINPYGGLKDKQHRGAISETPTDNPTGASGEGGWHRTDLDEYREMSPALKAAQQNLIALRNKEKAVNVPGKRERAPRDKVELDKPKPASVLTKGAQDVDPDTMDAIAAFLAKGGEIKKGRPGKAPPVGRNQASKHIGGGGKYRKKSDTPGQGANYRGAAIVAVEEEQLDEKCWTGYKQVGMKKKGGKEVPNCVPKESAIMKGLKR